MPNISNYLEERWLNHTFRGQVFASPAGLYVALFLNNPTDAGTGTEVSGVSYARQPVTFTAPQQISGKATITNDGDIEYPQAGSNWGTITHAAIYDALTGGNMLYYGPLNNPKLIETNDILKVLGGELKLTLD